MYQIHPVTEPRRKVYLVYETGEVYVYDSYRQFLSILRSDIIYGLGKSFREIRYRITRIIWNLTIERERVFTYWVAHWDHKSGPVIDPEQIKSDHNEYHNELYRQKRFSNWWYARNHREYIFRYDPVPNIGLRRYRHSCNHVHTTQERRWSLAAKDDGVKWRNKRNFRNLPTSWDDNRRNEDKNWKRNRKHQWKS